MKIEFTPEQEALRKELRAYFEELMTPELKKNLAHWLTGEGGGPLFNGSDGKDGSKMAGLA